MDNSHRYKVQSISGTGTSGAAGSVTWPTATGGTVTDNPGANQIVWVEDGPSPSCVLVGTNDPIQGNSQLDTVRWKECSFFGNATYDNSPVFPIVTGGCSGWKTLNAGNIKNFSLDHCYFTNCTMGIDWRQSSGFLKIASTFAGNNFCDVGQGNSGVLTINGFESEQSNMFYFQQGAGLAGQCNMQGVEWDGRTPGAGGAASPCIISGASLTLDACFFVDLNPNQTIATVILDNVFDTNTYIGSWSSRGCRFNAFAGYNDVIDLPLFDSGGNRLTPGGAGSDYTGRTLHRQFISSTNDAIYQQSGGNFTNTFPIPERLNADARGAQMHTGFFTSAGLAHVTAGSIIGSVLKVTIPFAAVQVAATTKTLNLAIAQNKCRIRGVFVDVTTAFAGVTGVTMSLGHASPRTSPTSTSNTSLLAAQSMTATGFFHALDAALTVWGPTGYGDASKEWFVNAVFTGGANLSGLTAGSVDICIEFEQLPIFGGGTTAATTVTTS